MPAQRSGARIRTKSPHSGLPGSFLGPASELLVTANDPGRADSIRLSRRAAPPVAPGPSAARDGGDSGDARAMPDGWGYPLERLAGAAGALSGAGIARLGNEASGLAALLGLSPAAAPPLATGGLIRPGSTPRMAIAGALRAAAAFLGRRTWFGAVRRPARRPGRFWGDSGRPGGS